MKLFAYEKKHSERLRDTLSECTVLLKKDGHFPLSGPCEIAAYGSGIRHTIKGGTGSGEVNSRYSVNVEEGLIEAGFTISTASWLDRYDKELEKAKEQFIRDVKAEAKAAGQNTIVYSMGKAMLEPDYNLPLEGSGDTCVYVLARISGEGNDRREVAGEIKLSQTEIRDILELNEQYEKFMLVLNVGGVVDLSPVMGVKNILLLSQLGAQTGTALADILLGKGNPSGRLSTTWAKVEDYPAMPDFEDINETKYLEGIYVGYRYFDTFQKRALFPFGYGLSYTEFTQEVDKVEVSGEEVSVSVNVANQGKYPGMDVVQLYLSVPTERLDHPYQELCAFAKSKILNPGESQSVSLTFKLSQMASYDEERALYFLERGDYLLRFGNHSGETKAIALIKMSQEQVILTAKNVFGKPGFMELTATGRAEEELNDQIPTLTIEENAFKSETVEYEPNKEILPEVAQLSVDELLYMNIGAFDPNKSGIGSIIGNAGVSVCGAAGETTSMVRDFPHLVMADGPAGLRLAKEFYRDEKGLHSIGQSAIPESMLDFMPKILLFLLSLTSSKKPKKGSKLEYQYCTAIPIGTAVAQSFNEELATIYGDVVGSEMERFGVHLWLAPALNIHRSIRCGRNFEYFSEDPFISGKMAASMTLGVQKHPGCGVTIKHYAANNKELNRYGNDSLVSERAMREIYTKGFGICVREAQPKAVMTSYNLVNGTHTAEHRGMIEDLLRAEYGFQGIVMTDWVIALATNKKGIHRNTLASYEAAAGSDVFMPGGKGDFKEMKRGLEEGIVTKEQLQINAIRVLKMARELTEARK
ncbi:beta-glucosidase [Lachnospiraceae bacterium PF1-22]|uniref:glycoside hydrolase family 3 N-terminal domain-containing protein n=1 Tax=Ohessyouella blattaphilus TaxID=2949333 RepID=UPI003E2E1440